MNHIHELASLTRDAMAPHCDRIEIAGSIRRGEEHPKDIEIVALGRMVSNVQNGMFDDQVVMGSTNLLEHYIQVMLESDDWERDTQNKKWGAKYKRLRHTRITNHKGDLVVLEMFMPDPRAWAQILTIRTGPDTFSKALVKRAHRLHMFVQQGLLHKHTPQFKSGPDGKPIREDCPRGDRCTLIVETSQEMDFLAQLGLPWIEPRERGRYLVSQSGESSPH